MGLYYIPHGPCLVPPCSYEEVEVTNFHTSWRDGLALCAIINRHRPDILNYDDCDPEKPLENLATAINVAEKELGITRLVDPEGNGDETHCVLYTLTFSRWINFHTFLFRELVCIRENKNREICQ